MNKIKIIPIIIAGLLIGLGASSIVNADTLSGYIDVTVHEWVGVVTPELKIDNESTVQFGVDIEGTGENITYTVNDTLVINLNITNNSERGEIPFVLPRSVFYTAFFFRIPILETKLFPLVGAFKRIFPVLEIFKSVNVIDAMLGANVSNNITIPVKYTINNDTYHNGENLTMHLWVMGFLPGSQDGIAEQIPIVGHQKIALEISYI